MFLFVPFRDLGKDYICVISRKIIRDYSRKFFGTISLTGFVYFQNGKQFENLELLLNLANPIQ